MCQSVSKCVYSNNKCKFRIPIDTFDNYLNQAVNELIQYNSITESKIVNTMNQTEDVIIFSTTDIESSNNIETFFNQLFVDF